MNRKSLLQEKNVHRGAESKIMMRNSTAHKTNYLWEGVLNRRGT